MKQRNTGKISYVAILLSALALGCAKPPQFTTKVTPSPLELHGDSVVFSVEAKTEPIKLSKNKKYMLESWYAYGDQKMNFPTVNFTAEDFPNAKTTGVQLKETFSFYYKEDMRVGEVMGHGVMESSNGKRKTSPDTTIAYGTITTSRMVDYIYEPAFADHGYNNKEELIPTYVNFFFDQGSARLRYKERVGETGDFLKGFISDQNKTRTVVFTGSHSPEGPEAVNVDLAEDRAKAVEGFYNDFMKRYDKEQIDSVDFVTKSIVRDWDIVIDSLNDTKVLSEDQVKQVKEMIRTNKNKTFEEVEDMLQELPFYNEMLRKFYPSLRTVRTEILTVKPKKSDAEISQLAKKITMDSVPADTLNVQEIGYAATLTPDLDEKVAIYKAAIKKLDTFSFHNNLAAVYLTQAKMKSGDARLKMVEQAMSHLKLAENLNPAPEVMNNMAVANLMQGNLDEALKNIAQASTKASDPMLKQIINSNLGPMKIRTAEYGQAMSALNSGKKDNKLVAYNTGLVHLLQNDASKAETALNNSLEMDDNMAKAHYLLAIAYARKNNETEMANHLNKSISLESDMRKRALNDLEFKKYWETQAFKDAVR